MSPAARSREPVKAAIPFLLSVESLATWAHSTGSAISSIALLTPACFPPNAVLSAWTTDMSRAGQVPALPRLTVALEEDKQVDKGHKSDVKERNR